MTSPDHIKYVKMNRDKLREDEWFIMGGYIVDRYEGGTDFLIKKDQRAQCNADLERSEQHRSHIHLGDDRHAKETSSSLSICTGDRQRGGFEGVNARTSHNLKGGRLAVFTDNKQ